MAASAKRPHSPDLSEKVGSTPSLPPHDTSSPSSVKAEAAPVKTDKAKRSRWRKSKDVPVDGDASGKDKDDHVKPVAITSLYRYATRTELALNGIGLLCSIAAGAGQPLMTLMFGNVTKAFTDYGMLMAQIQLGMVTGDLQAALTAAKHHLKYEAGRMALWITVIGRLK